MTKDFDRYNDTIWHYTAYSVYNCTKHESSCNRPQNPPTTMTLLCINTWKFNERACRNDNDIQLNIATIHLDTKSVRAATGMLQYDPMPCKVLCLSVLQFACFAIPLQFGHTRSLLYVGLSWLCTCTCSLSVRFPSCLLMMLRQPYRLLSAQTFDTTSTVHAWLMFAKCPTPRPTLSKASAKRRKPGYRRGVACMYTYIYM